MVSNKDLIRQVEDQESEIFGPCHEFLEEQQRQQVANYSWKNTGYAIYPSSIKSIRMCPKEYIEEDVHNPILFSFNALLSMQEGKEVHSYYESIMKRIPGFLAQPDLSYFCSLYPDHAESIIEKNKLAYPEVYFKDPEAGISGRIDVVKAAPACIIADIKTKRVPDIQFDRNKKAFRQGFWEEEKRKPIEEAHKVQVGIYLYYCKKYRYFNPEMSYGMIAYINTCMKKGGQEYYETPKFAFTQSMYNSIDELVAELKKHRNTWIATSGEVKESCTYSLCPTHSKLRI